MIVKRHNDNGGGTQTPRRIITHCVAEFVNDGSRIQWAPDFETRIGLSAHYYITPSGVVIEQRDPQTIAYHARGNNENTLGVEWMVPGIHGYASFIHTIEQDWVSEAQWEAGVNLYRNLIDQYPIETNQRHSDIDPGRKDDPGDGFRWHDFQSRIW